METLQISNRLEKVNSDLSLTCPLEGTISFTTFPTCKYLSGGVWGSRSRSLILCYLWHFPCRVRWTHPDWCLRIVSRIFAEDFTEIIKHVVIDGDSKLTLSWQINGGRVLVIDFHADWSDWSLEFSAQHFSHLEETCKWTFTEWIDE